MLQLLWYLLLTVLCRVCHNVHLLVTAARGFPLPWMRTTNVVLSILGWRNCEGQGVDRSVSQRLGNSQPQVSDA